MLTVVKIGGAVAADPGALADVARGVSGLGGPAVVVHGGGAEITAWQERLGVEVRWEDGLRVTTPEGARVTAMVLSGWTNKRVVGAFLDAGEAAVGISGEDGLLRAERKRDGRLGDVGEVVEVSPLPLRALLAAGIVPVVSPVSRGPGGVPLNVNSDEAAAALAAGLGARTLMLCSDVPGVVRDGRTLPELTAAAARALIDEGVATGGMAVKLRQALVAAEAGVDVRIGGHDLLDDPAAGTRVLADPSVAGPGRSGPRTAGRATRKGGTEGGTEGRTPDVRAVEV